MTAPPAATRISRTTATAHHHPDIPPCGSLVALGDTAAVVVDIPVVAAPADRLSVVGDGVGLDPAGSDAVGGVEDATGSGAD